jgi:hypothetical protein
MRQMAAVTGVLFLLNVLVPDPIPFVDEVLLGLVTLLLARRKEGGHMKRAKVKRQRSNGDS